jgi:hypothetical protein
MENNEEDLKKIMEVLSDKTPFQLLIEKLWLKHELQEKNYLKKLERLEKGIIWEEE